ncbi:MAG: type II CAAX endopeptidase family protein [Anaerolineae bacterium]
MNAIAVRIRRSPLVAFFVLAYLLSWSVWLLLAVSSISINSTVGNILNVIAIAGPTLSALILTAITQGTKGLQEISSRLQNWRVPVRWYVIALLLPFLLIVISLVISYFMMTPAPALSGSKSLLLLLPEFVRILFFGGPLGEEIGWRGFALPRLLAGRNTFSASIILGVIWGLWHAPIYAVPGTGQNEIVRNDGSFVVFFAAFVIWTIGLSILFTWLYRITQGNLLMMILFHAAINTAVFLPFLLGMQNSPVTMVNAGLTWVTAFLVSRRPIFMENKASDYKKEAQ